MGTTWLKNQKEHNYTEEDTWLPHKNIWKVERELAKVSLNLGRYNICRVIVILRVNEWVCPVYHEIASLSKTIIFIKFCFCY